MASRPFFAVRVVVVDHNDNGTTYVRDFVRGPMRIGRLAFEAYAVGYMLLALDLGDHKVSIDWEEITENEVR